jgi:hypothetical protein
MSTSNNFKLHLITLSNELVHFDLQITPCYPLIKDMLFMCLIYKSKSVQTNQVTIYHCIMYWFVTATTENLLNIQNLLTEYD